VTASLYILFVTDELPEAVLIDVPVALSEEMQLLGLPGSFERPTLRVSPPSED